MADQTSSSPGLCRPRVLAGPSSARALSHMPTHACSPTPSIAPERPPSPGHTGGGERSGGSRQRRRRRFHLLRGRGSPAGGAGTHASSGAFRRALVNAAPSKRGVRLDTGRVVELTPMPMGGNCGFVAVSWALLIAGRLPGNDVSGTWVRRTLARHVAAQAGFYAEQLAQWGVVQGGREAGEDSVRGFVVRVREDGVKGHWLGEMWGFLEIFAVARALAVNVELYVFDVASQRVRMYHQQNEGKDCVALLFSGQAKGGHFDLLLPVKRAGEGWLGRRRRRRP